MKKVLYNSINLWYNIVMKKLYNTVLIGLMLGLTAALIDIHLIPGGIY